MDLIRDMNHIDYFIELDFYLSKFESVEIVK